MCDVTGRLGCYDTNLIFSGVLARFPQELEEGHHHARHRPRDQHHEDPAHILDGEGVGLFLGGVNTLPVLILLLPPRVVELLYRLVFL